MFQLKATIPLNIIYPLLGIIVKLGCSHSGMSVGLGCSRAGGSNKELGVLYFSSNIRAIKSRRVRWAGLVARIREKLLSLEKPEGKRPL